MFENPFYKPSKGDQPHANENSSIDLNWNPVLLETKYISPKNLDEEDNTDFNMEKLIQTACQTHGVSKMKCDSILNTYVKIGTVPQWLATYIKDAQNQ